MANRREEEGSGSARPGWSARRSRRAASGSRLMIGYGVAGGGRAWWWSSGSWSLVASGGGGARRRRPHQPGSGSTNGVQPDDRAGTEAAAGQGRQPEAGGQAGRLRRCGCTCRKRGTTTSRRARRPPHYKTNPPTSGNHVEPPYQQADGAYSEMPAEIDFVHSLEHGRLEIQYSPEPARSRPAGAEGPLRHDVRRRRCSSPTKRCPTRWRRRPGRNLLGCPKYKGAITLDAIRDFGKATWSESGSEPATAFPFTGPTPANPRARRAAGRPGRSRRWTRGRAERRA